MSENDLIKIINKKLQTGWSESEIKNGKIVNVKWVWHKEINTVVNLYEANGWEVKKNVELSSFGRKLFLTFKNSKWD